MGKRERGQALEAKLNEKSAFCPRSWRPGWAITTGAGVPVLVLLLAGGHCLDTSLLAVATSDLTEVDWHAPGKEEPAPQMLCLGWIHSIFLKSQSYFNFMQQKSNQRGLTAGAVFHFSCLMWRLRLKSAPEKIRVRPESNHPYKQHLQVTHNHPCCREGSFLLSCLENIGTPHHTEACWLPANMKGKKRKEAKKKVGWGWWGGRKGSQHCCSVLVFVVIQFPRWEQRAIRKSIILGGIFSAVFPTECECLFSCRQMDRACRITFTGEKPALKSFDSRHSIWSISIETSSLPFIFCQLPISS